MSKGNYQQAKRRIADLQDQLSVATTTINLLRAQVNALQTQPIAAQVCDV